jgi:hypothetical protein
MCPSSDSETVRYVADTGVQAPVFRTDCSAQVVRHIGHANTACSGTLVYSTLPPEHCSLMHACMRPARKNRSRRDASVDGMDRQATSWRVAFRSFDNQKPSRPYVGVCRGGLLAAAGVQAEHDLQGQARPCPSVWCSLLAPSPSTDSDHSSCAEMRGVACVTN